MHIVCPICKVVMKDAPDDHAFRPFCSKRCKLADLHNWLTDEYRISSPLNPGELDDDEHKFS